MIRRMLLTVGFLLAAGFSAAQGQGISGSVDPEPRPGGSTLDARHVRDLTDVTDLEPPFEELDTHHRATYLTAGYLAVPRRMPAQVPTRVVLDAGGTLARTDLSWDVAASRLDYRDLRIRGMDAGLRLRVDDDRESGLVLLAEIGRGELFSGSVEDVDGNRDPEIRFEARIPGSGAGREKVGLLWSQAVEAWPVVDRVDVAAGWSWRRTRLRMRDGIQTTPYRRELTGLESRYRAEWRGPWFSVEPRMRMGRAEFGVAVAYLDGDYQGEGIWNLRHDLAQAPSFVHGAEGHGWRVGLTYTHHLRSHLALTLDASWRSLRAKDGHDRLFFADGRAGRGQLEEVSWTSRGIRLAVEGSL